ncbi:integrin alpha-D-like [Chamaea fasciata]|uniref:integrin alpha-D-like n=1 Tax=Chamaea fasciata TaxID=190680 RepID=UPI00336A1CFA
MEPGKLLALLGTALLCRGLDLETPTVFRGDAAGGFGATVAQFGTSDDGWILVGAPQERSGPDDSGAVYHCRFRSRNCQKLPVTGPPGAVNSSLGLALAAGDDAALVCGPTSPQTCGVNVHLNGFCVHLDSALQRVRNIPETFPECPKTSMDIAFLMDGSGSISHNDFETMKRFIVEVMRRFRDDDAQFSLTQFSSTVKIHFDFKTFRNSPWPELLLRDVRQFRGTTHTATAIKTVLEEMFVSGRGARPAARRILIVVTDGEKYGDTLEYSDVIPLAERMAVTRYAIGVGRDFQSPHAQGELQAIASGPAHDHVFRVDNFDALADIQSQLREKIFAIEGTSSAHSSSFQLEMAQEGFSALLTAGGAVLGAVGAFDWSGGAFVYGGGATATPTFVNDSGSHLGDMRDAYLGYSVAQVHLPVPPGLWLWALPGSLTWARCWCCSLDAPGRFWARPPGHRWAPISGPPCWPWPRAQVSPGQVSPSSASWWGRPSTTGAAPAAEWSCASSGRGLTCAVTCPCGAHLGSPWGRSGPAWLTWATWTGTGGPRWPWGRPWRTTGVAPCTCSGAHLEASERTERSAFRVRGSGPARSFSANR